MLVIDALRASGLARAGLLALVVLAYLVYTVGTLLEHGVGRFVADPPVGAVLTPTVVLVVVVVVVDRYFRPGDAG